MIWEVGGEIRRLPASIETPVTLTVPLSTQEYEWVQQTVRET